MIDVVAMGEVLIDFTPAKENEQGTALFARNPGGAPANVLSMNAKLGGKAAFIGKVGDDAFGVFLRQALIENIVDVSGLVVDKKIPTTLAFVHLDEQGDRSFSFYRNPGADMMLCSSEVNRALIAESGIFHFGSVSLTEGPSHNATIEAALYAKQLGKIVSFDPNYRSSLWKDEAEAFLTIEGVISIANLVKMSGDEMALLTKETDASRGSELIMGYGAELVLISLGANGSFYRNKACCGYLPAYDVKTVDTTGAGDAFMGAILYKLAGKTVEQIGFMPPHELEEIVRFANAAGSLTTTRSGAIPAMPTMDEINACIATVPLL